MNKEHQSVLNELARITNSKQQDYSNSGPDENFERSSLVASWFVNDIDKSFAVLIGTKLARLATLLRPNKSAKNESIMDSFMDLSNYCVLWTANYMRRIQSKSEESELTPVERYAEVISDREMRIPLKLMNDINGSNEISAINESRKTGQELMYLIHRLNEDEQKDLISRARIYISRK